MILIAVAALFLIQAPGSGRPARSGESAISGQLRKPDGSSAAGVRITLVSAEETSAAAEFLISIAQTDPDGRYRLDQVPSGRYFLMAGPFDGAVYFPGVGTRSGATVVTVADGRPVGPLNFKVGFSLTGQILNESGGVIGSGSGNLLLEDSRGAKTEIRQSRDGHFEFRYLWPGQYGLVVGSTRVADFTVSDKDIEGLQIRVPRYSVPGVSPQPVRGTPREMRLVEITIENGGRLPVTAPRSINSLLVEGVPQLVARNTTTGLLTGRPVAAGSQTIVISAGQYYFDGLSRVEYWIGINALPEGWYVKSMTYGGVDLTTSPLRVTADPNPPPIQITLTSTRPASAPKVFEVRGRVTNLTEEVKADSGRVTIQRTSLEDGIVGHAFQTRVQPDGGFKLQGIPPGVYTLGLDMGNGMPPVTQRIVVTARDLTTVEISSSAALPLFALACAGESAVIKCFDIQRRVVLEGVLKELTVRNPRTLAVLTITDDKGPRNIDLVGSSAVPATRSGFAKNKVGDRLKIVINPRLDGGEGGRIVSFVGPDGKEIDVWSYAQ